MRKMFALLLIGALTASISAVGAKAHADKWEDMITEAGKVLKEVNSMPDTAIPSDLFKKCKAIAIFPSTVGGGFIFGAKYGQGVVLYKDDRGNWSAPAVFNIGGGSFGGGGLLLCLHHCFANFLEVVFATVTSQPSGADSPGIHFSFSGEHTVDELIGGHFQRKNSHGNFFV